MAEAIKCDLTGELVEGAGHKTVYVELGGGLRLSIVPQVRTGKDRWGQGVVSDAGKHLIETAAATLVRAEAEEAGAS